jgi:hypothetical protein
VGSGIAQAQIINVYPYHERVEPLLHSSVTDPDAPPACAEVDADFARHTYDLDKGNDWVGIDCDFYARMSRYPECRDRGQVVQNAEVTLSAYALASVLWSRMYLLSATCRAHYRTEDDDVFNETSLRLSVGPSTFDVRTIQHGKEIANPIDPEDREFTVFNRSYTFVVPKVYVPVTIQLIGTGYVDHSFFVRANGYAEVGGSQRTWCTGEAFGGVGVPGLMAGPSIVLRLLDTELRARLTVRPEAAEGAVDVILRPMRVILRGCLEAIFWKWCFDLADWSVDPITWNLLRFDV